MREQINKYPYGEYYGLKPNQPKDIIRLLNEMDNADEYIKKIFFEKENLQSKIDEANKILDKLCIYGYEQVNCRPIKNTTKQEVYNAMYEIKNILKEDK